MQHNSLLTASGTHCARQNLTTLHDPLHAKRLQLMLIRQHPPQLPRATVVQKSGYGRNQVCSHVWMSIKQHSAHQAPECTMCADGCRAARQNPWVSAGMWQTPPGASVTSHSARAKESAAPLARFQPPAIHSLSWTHPARCAAACGEARPNRISRAKTVVTQTTHKAGAALSTSLPISTE